MLKNFYSRLLGALRRIDAIAEKILNGLSRLYNVLTQKLDLALEKLDQLTKRLLRNYYRALDYLERLFRILRKLLRVLFPIILLFVPSMAGYIIAYVAYDYSVQDSIIIGLMTTVLLLILLASFRSKAETASEPEAAVAVAAELDELGVGKKIFGGIIAGGFLLLAGYLSPGLFIGVMIYIFQVVVLYIMKWLYGTEPKQSLAAT